MMNFVPDFVGNELLAAAVVVTALDVDTVLDVTIGGLDTTVVKEDTDAFEADV